jgi:aminoglycoside phosphotransferase (APT) family kinase protein
LGAILDAARPGATADGATSLAGGAAHHCWRLGWCDGAARGTLIVKATASRLPEAGDRAAEARALTLAAKRGVPVPRVLAASPDWLALEDLPGATAADPILDLADTGPLLADVATALGRLHAAQQGSPADHLGARVGALRRHLDAMGAARPVFEWGLRRAELARLPPAATVALHRDCRVGNLLVDGGRLVAMLDWEFALNGDAHEDLGWFGMRYWRRHRGDRPAGGLGDWPAFAPAYQAAGGPAIDPRRRLAWELVAAVRWGVIALAQAGRFQRGEDRALVHAASGRRLPEVEAEILALADRLDAHG